MALLSYLQMAILHPLDLLMRGRIQEQYYGSGKLSDTPAGASAEGISGGFSSSSRDCTQQWPAGLLLALWLWNYMQLGAALASAAMGSCRSGI